MNIFIRFRSKIAVSAGIIFLFAAPVAAQNVLKALSNIPKSSSFFSLSGKQVSSEVLGKYANSILKSKLPSIDGIQRQVINQMPKNGLFPGYYNVYDVNTQTISYLHLMQNSLNALYPNTQHRFAPVTVSSFREIMEIWQNGPKENFMSARNAVAFIVERTGSGRAGFYAVAVENPSASGQALHDILILDVNRGRWISLRESMDKAHPAALESK